MISVGSRDGRKGMGLGFDVPREMEETELEEGEACSFPDDDPSVDPDIALSYIDEKIQDVLGHFQKDFEGGVSAENLGAKFGGYGSFLPTYQRSPLWSHPRSPASSQIRNTHSSPNNLKMEGGRLNSVVPSSAPQKRLDMAPSNSMSLPAVMKPFANDMAKSEVDKIPCDSAQEFTSRPNHEDQKTLKVRIKVGSDNLMTRKNAEIYSGLGLDDSPSLSLDESPTESEGLSHVPQALESSPTSILQIMTSFPVYGDLLLSPISDDLLCLTEKKCLREIKRRPFTKNKQDIPNGFGNGLVPLKGDQRILGNRKIKSVGSKGSPVELENGNKDTQNENGVGYNKKVGVDLLGCEELVLKALKPPLLVNSYSAVGGTEKSAVNPCDMHRESNKGKDKSFSVLAKEEVQDPMATEEIVCAEQPNGKSASAVKVWEDMNPNSLNDASVCGRSDGDREAGRAYDSIKAESNASKGKKVPAVELLDPPKQKGSQKVISHEQESLKEPIVGKEVSSSIGKKKSKGSQVHSNPGADMLKESWRADPPLLLKNKKGIHGDNCLLKGELGASKTHKAIRKASEANDRYKDFFGDMNMEEDEYEMDSVEMPYDGRVNSEVVEKRTSSFSSGSRDKMSSKKNDKASKSDYFAKVVSSTTSLGGNGPSSEAVPLMGNGPNGDAFPLIRNGPNFDAPSSGNGPISDATLPNGNGPNSDVTPAVVAPAGIEEKDGWVCCDKCQKWRLLPIGTNPDDLPEKWLCSMLNWLPGMNRCSVSEEETTNALTQRYQAPPTGSQNYLHGHADTIVSTVNGEDFRLLNQSRQNDCFHGPANGKKKNELKEMSNSFDQCAPPHFSNPTKKNLQALAKCKNLYDVNQLASSSDHDFQQSSKSSDLHSEKQRLMPKEKHKVIEQSPRGGDTKKIKVKSRWEIDPQDCSSDIKKFKKDGIQNLDEDQISNRIGANDKVGPSLSGLETDVTMMDRPKHSVRSSSVDLKCDVKDESQHSARKLKNNVQATLNDKEMLDSKDATKKRKVKDSLESKDVLQELSGNDKGKGKKARLLKYDAKEPNGSKASTRKDKKDDCIHQCLDGTDPLKKDLGSVQPSVATTSSSSKVSGSHKTKVNILELKSSPVESVSSSPLRISILDKPTSVRRNAIANGSPRRCLDSAYDRSGRSERSKNNRNANSTHHRSFESPVLDIQERDHSHLTGSKAKQLYFSELKNSDLPTNVSHTLGHDTQCSSELQALDYFHNEEINHENHYHDHGSHLRKSGKGSSTCSKDNDRSYKSEFDNGKTRISDSSIDCLDHAHSHKEKTKERKRKSHEKTGLKYAKTDNISAGKKLKLSSGNNKRESRSKVDEHNLDVKVDGICSQNEMSSPNRNRLLDRDGERSSKKFHSDKINRANLVPGRGSSLPLPPSGGGENEARIRSQKPSSWSHKGPGPDASDVGEDALVMEKHHRMVDNQNGSRQTSSRQSTPSGQRGRAFDAPSPVRRDSSQEAPSLLKEATNLKHMADRFKNAGSYGESTGLYFQASLKFLHAASLMESGNIDGGKHAEMIQSMQIYSTTAKLFEFCAHEYEKLKDMAAAALACKCAEVAYMRVIYSSHNTASRDRHDLQVSLQMIAPGESPSSSASDVDNLNNPPTADKFALAKGVGSPQVAGNHVIAARHRPNFIRLLTFTQNVNSAMEASRKSSVAFSAAKVHLEDAQHSEGISSIKRALDYNFQDVEGLLRLVRLAMEAMSRG